MTPRKFPFFPTRRWFSLGNWKILMEVLSFSLRFFFLSLARCVNTLQVSETFPSISVSSLHWQFFPELGFIPLRIFISCCDLRLWTENVFHNQNLSVDPPVVLRLSRHPAMSKKHLTTFFQSLPVSKHILLHVHISTFCRIIVWNVFFFCISLDNYLRK
jgi:hypothetical protein